LWAIRTNICAQLQNVGWDSIVGIATCYVLGDPGTESCRGKIFHPSKPALGPTQPPTQWVLDHCHW